MADENGATTSAPDITDLGDKIAALTITKAVQLYQSLYGNLPDGYDLLTDGTAIINYLPAIDTPSPMLYGETPGQLPNGNVFNAKWVYPSGGYLTPGALTKNALASLNGAGIVNEYADDVTILYAARVMEQTAASELFRNPLNPYTKGLLGSIPGIDGKPRRRMQAIPGMIPSALKPPAGCRFHPRCPIAVAQCSAADPPLQEKAPDHYVACIRV